MRKAANVPGLGLVMGLWLLSPAGCRIDDAWVDDSVAAGGAAGAGRGGMGPSLGRNGGTGGGGGRGGTGMNPGARGGASGGASDGRVEQDVPPASEAGPDVTSDLPVAPDAAVVPDVTVPVDGAPVEAPGLVAHWKLDDGGGNSAADSSASGSNGMVLGGARFQGAGFPAARFANTGALELDGVDDQVLADGRRLPAVNAPKTVSLWVRYPAGASGVDAFISLTNRAQSCGLHIGRRSGRLTAWNWGGELLAGASEPPAGWHHVLYTYDGQRHSLRIDGGNAATSDIPGQACPVIDAVLGNYQGGGNFFVGTLDDVRVYDRVLGDAQARALAGGFEPTEP